MWTEPSLLRICSSANSVAIYPILVFINVINKCWIFHHILTIVFMWFVHVMISDMLTNLLEILLRKRDQKRTTQYPWLRTISRVSKHEYEQSIIYCHLDCIGHCLCGLCCTVSAISRWSRRQPTLTITAHAKYIFNATSTMSAICAYDSETILTFYINKSSYVTRQVSKQA